MTAPEWCEEIVQHNVKRFWWKLVIHSLKVEMGQLFFSYVLNVLFFFILKIQEICISGFGRDELKKVWFKRNSNVF